MITHAQLKEVLNYDPASGNFYWKVTSGRAVKGAIAGTLNGKGHRQVTISGGRYLMHRLAWFYHYGVWPLGEIDHANLDGLDNSISNLRDIGANRSLQRANQHVRADNRIGVKGVGKTKSGKFRARLAKKHLGTFKTAEEAHAAYANGAKMIFGPYARLI